MSDMTEIAQLETCREQLIVAGLTSDSEESTTPISINSTFIKAFCREHQARRAPDRMLEVSRTW
jgi:hypothetical protein